tara:strand:+ start:3893 stop:4729 length:837 start_codon:yes stop_codon:yes gene_type:complete
MITDINQNIISTAKGNVKSINELYEIILKNNDIEKPDIIGFAKFEPFLDHDKKFENILDKGRWYPIVNKPSENKDNLSIDIEGANDTYLGLFSSIVPAIGHKSLFDKFKNDNPEVKKHYQEIKKEYNKKEQEKSFLLGDKETEKEEYERLNQLRGQKVRRQDLLSNYLKNKVTKQELFTQLQNLKLRSKIKQDLNYRLKTIEIAKNIPKTKSYYFKFKGCEGKEEIKMLELKKEINDFNFNCQKSFNEKFPKETITDFLKDKIKKVMDRGSKRKRAFS